MAGVGGPNTSSDSKSNVSPKGSALASAALQAPNPNSADPHPPKVNTDAGSPAWWLKYLVNQLLARQGEYRKRKEYFEGDQMLPKGDQRYMRALKHLQTLAATNYIGMITTTPVERMEIQGFRFGDPGTMDEDATEIWANSDMELQSHTIHMNAAKYGLAYALVTPPAEGQQYPTITAEDPRTAIVYRDPTKPTKALAGLRMWEDEIVGRILAVVYLPEGAYGFVGPYLYETDGLTIQDLQERLTQQFPSHSGFTPSGFVPNPDDVQEVALTEYVWRPDTGPIPTGECGRDIRRVQDRINQTIFQRMCITHFQAYKQRWASGITIPTKGRHKGRKAPFDPGYDTLWAVESDVAKFGEFSEADITQILEAVRDDVADIAALTKTPAHYLMGKMANISGETLTQAESGLVSKTRIRMSSMGWSHGRVMKLCFAYMGDTEKATAATSAVIWSNPGRELIADTALAGTQWQTLGVPLPLIMEAQGNWTDDQIAFATQYAEEQEQKQLVLQQQQMEMQQQNAVELAKVGGAAKPGAPGKPGTAQKPATKPGAKTAPASPKKKPMKGAPK